jgi:hypothetical protein
MVNIHHGVLPLPTKPLSTTTRSSATSSITSTDVVSTTTSVLSSLTRSLQSQWASQEYSQLHYDRVDGKYQRALSSYTDVMHYDRKQQLSNVIGINIIV